MSIGRLERNIDLDLLAKMHGGWKPSPGKTLARKFGARKVRHVSTYRAARRNAMKRSRG